ncbi:MAG: hypothetical protein ABSB83_02220 [Methanomassiliicoccales archaeon]
MKVDPGVCRFKSRIVGSPEGTIVHLKIESDCPCVQELAEELMSVDSFEALKMPYSNNLVYTKSGKVLNHSTCPVPMAILKCIEAAAGLALKKNVRVEFEK